MGQKINKSLGQKKLVKSNKSISRKKFGPNFIFCDFKNGQKSIFELAKSLKLPEMQFHEKKNELFDFMSFFCLNFFEFSGLLCFQIGLPTI